MKGLVVCCLVLICWGYASSQDIRSPKAPEDLTVLLEPLDSVSVAYGLTEEAVHDVLRLSVERTGWKFRSGSDNIISVKLTPLAQRQEDLFTFQIDATAGAGARGTHEGTAGLRASSIVDVPAGGSARLLSQINELVSKVARKLRQESMKRHMRVNPTSGSEEH